MLGHCDPLLAVGDAQFAGDKPGEERVANARKTAGLERRGQYAVYQPVDEVEFG